jgi:hypothetical protein
MIITLGCFYESGCRKKQSLCVSFSDTFDNVCESDKNGVIGGIFLILIITFICYNKW